MDVVNFPLVAGAKNNDPKRVLIHSMGEWIVVDLTQSESLKNQGFNIEPGEYFAPIWLGMLGLSAHVLVSPSGVAIQCRKEYNGAYHARNFNTDSLGLEFMVPGKWHISDFNNLMRRDVNYLTSNQYETGITIAKLWRANHGIGIESGELDRHSDVSPGRKLDPGKGFPWVDFKKQIA